MMCPKCANERVRVLNTSLSGGITKRIRKCSRCEYVFKTIEYPYFEEEKEEERREYAEFIDKEVAEIKAGRVKNS